MNEQNQEPTSCWFCAKNAGDGVPVKVKMSKCLRRDKTVDVPRCKNCAKAHARTNRRDVFEGLLFFVFFWGLIITVWFKFGFWMCLVAAVAFFAVLFSVTVPLVKFKVKFSGMWRKIWPKEPTAIGPAIKNERETGEFPGIKALAKRGWEQGFVSQSPKSQKSGKRKRLAHLLLKLVHGVNDQAVGSALEARFDEDLINQAGGKGTVIHGVTASMHADLLPYADVVLEMLGRTPPPTAAELADDLNELAWPGDTRLPDPDAIARCILFWWERESAPASTTDVATEQSQVEQEQASPAAVTLPAEIASVCRNATNGTPTTFMCYGSDEALFMARLKPFSAYARTRNGKFSVVGVRDDAKRDFMIVCAGSISEDAAFSAVSNSGGAIDELDRALLSETELQMRRPVDAYSNFAQPGCELMSLTGFNLCVEALRSGRYKVVRPDISQPVVAASEPTRKPPASRQTGSDMTAIGTRVVRCTMPCERDWKVSEVEVHGTDGSTFIKWTCPECGRNYLQGL